jgi:hypothetical protein
MKTDKEYQHEQEKYNHSSPTATEDKKMEKHEAKEAKVAEEFVFVPLTVEEQKTIYATDPEGWKKIQEDLHAKKHDALEKSRESEDNRHAEDLKRLRVKLWDESKPKPDYLCVVKGCGEEKATGQNVCVKHIRAA